MHTIHQQTSKLLKLRPKILLVCALILLFFIVLFGVGARVHAKPNSGASPPQNILNNGGVMRWLYYGNIRVENKNGGKHWDYAWNPDTESYVLAEAGECDGIPNDQIKITSTRTADGVTQREVILAPEGGKSQFCDQKSTSTSTPENPERKNALFYRIEGKEGTIKMWNTKKTGETFKRQKAKITGWDEVFYRNNDGSATCRDTLARKGDAWIFFTLIEWTDGVKRDYPFIEGAKSQDAASILGSGAYENCRVASFEVINIFETGIKNGQTLGTAQDYDLEASRKLNNLDDDPGRLCNKLPNIGDGKYIDVLETAESNNSVGKIVIKYNGTELSSGHNWIFSCEDTGDDAGSFGSGDWSYHTLKAWDTRAYGMTQDSNRRLLDLSHIGLNTYKGGGDLDNDGYSVKHGVALISASEESGANPNIDAEPPKNPDATNPEDDAPSCNIDGIGWIICPVMTFMADVNDRAFGFLSTYFLEIDKGYYSTNSGTYEAWKLIRNFANAMFVIVTLVIIYSQMTGAGISNYGIKRLLPRLLVAAILVNASFIICQIAIDLSNIVGKGMYDILNQGTARVTIEEGNNITDTNFGVKETIVAVLAAGVGIALVLATGILPVALLALFLIVFILMARIAAIVILVALAPLAFVAYLLPNTQQYFDKWRKIFTAMLLLYPIIGIVFGGSVLAASLVQGASSSSDNWVMDLIALGIICIPLFAIPAILKGSMGALGAIGGKLTGAMDRANNATMAKGKKGVGDKYNNTAFARGRNARKQLKQAYGDRRYAQGVSGEDTSLMGRARRRASRGVIGRGILPSGQYAQEGAGRSAVAAADKHFREDVSNAHIEQQDMGFEERMHMARTGTDKDGNQLSAASHTAAIQYGMKKGNLNERQELIASAGNLQGAGYKRQRQALSDGYYESSMNGVHGSAFGDMVAQDDFGGMSESDINLAMAAATADEVVGKNKLKAETLADDALAAEYVAKQMGPGGSIRGDNRRKVKEAAVAAETTPALKGKLNEKSRQAINFIKSAP